MKEKRLAQLARIEHEKGKRIVAPLVGFPGVDLVGSNIKLAQQNFGEHFKTVKKLVDRFNPDLVFPLMDLSVEANALGRYVVFPKEDSATVPKDNFHIDDLIKMNEVNFSFDNRIIGYVETLKLMSIGLPSHVMKGAYVTGPYTLAALIMGVDEAAMATMISPGDLHKLCDFTTEKIEEYTRLLISAGAQLICILEPSAVMLGPEQFIEFSSNYVKHLNESCKFSGVSTIYHICGNTMHLIQGMVAAEVDGLSLDSPETGIDLAQVMKMVPSDLAIIGNVNPTAVLLQGTPQTVRTEVVKLLQDMRAYPNFILSTGCDLPQETPLENIEAFMRAGRGGA
jgi:uroporphyrinogen decarboxylase